MQERATASRRQMLAGSVASGLSMSLSGLLRAELAAGSTGAHRIRSCIFVFYYGGPSHLDTYDLKPAAPSTVRGEFNPIDTTVPGIRISEHLPQMARVMHHCAIVRSMHHSNRLHDSASTEVFTGRPGLQGDREEFSPIPQFFPSHGAVVNHLGFRESARIAPVAHAALPWLIHNVVTTPCQGGGFLGQEFDPFEINADLPALRYQVEMLRRLDQLSPDRMQHRQDLLNRLDIIRTAVSNPQATQLNEYGRRALELLDSPALHNALDISQESAVTRARYGLTTPVAQPGDAAAALAVGRDLRGQNLLLARRLVEAGVPFVNVNDFRQQGQNWDAHTDNFGQHRKYLLPQADRALAALIEDLDERGLLESTLVVATGEFGRTPTINASAGRDHWPDCYSVVLAGGGVRGGQVFGSSDRIGAYPETDPVTPADLAATIFWRFGIDPTTEVRDTTNRPHRIATGDPIARLFA
ncbi:MAG: DUF1501 domain-containing protein [Planctomycetaceae bacterium]|nr:DUF1501 domain-containing protein [Planctomycetaceae bacterium]